VKTKAFFCRGKLRGSYLLASHALNMRPCSGARDREAIIAEHGYSTESVRNCSQFGGHCRADSAPLGASDSSK